MSPIDHQVKQARRQLWINAWLRRLGASLLIGAAVFAALTVIERVGGFDWPLLTIGWVLAAASGVCSVMWALARADDAMAAAVALDEAAGLAERVSTGLYCGNSEDPFHRAVREDADQRVAGLNVRVHLPVRWPDALTWGSSAVVLSLMVYWLLPAMDLFGRQRESDERELAAQKQEVRRDAVLQQVAQLKMLREAAPVLKDNEEFAEELDLDAANLDTVMDPRREKVRMLENLTEAVEKQKENDAYQSIQEMKRMMRRLRDPEGKDSPVSDLSEALAKGDFKKAHEALNRLQDELATAEEEGNREQIEQLQKQLDGLGKKLEKLAADSKKLQDTLQQAGIDPKDMEKILQALKKNDLESVKEKLQASNLSPEQIAEMVKKLSNRQAAEQMCQKMGSALIQAASPMGGSASGSVGTGAMAMASDMLSQAESLSQEMAQLDAALSQLGNMKAQAGKSCSSCSGIGCSACDGAGPGNKSGQGMGRKMGQGSGGLAPEQQTRIGFTKERSPVETVPGAIIGELLIEGSQFKREAMAEFAPVIISAEEEATQAIARDKVPPYARKAVKQYFSRGRARVTGQESQTSPQNDNSQ